MNCGAPGYSNPCATCAGKMRDAQEAGQAAQAQPVTQAAQPVAPQPNEAPLDIDDFPRWRAFMEQFQSLRAGAEKGSVNPNEWQMALETIADLATRGLGQAVKLPPQPQAAPAPAPAPQAPATTPQAPTAPAAAAPQKEAPAPQAEAPEPIPTPAE